MRASLPIIVALASFAGAPAPALWAQEPTLEPLRLVHAQAQARAADLADQRDRVAVWAEEQYRLIPEARQRGDKELRAALRLAQLAADSLAILDDRIAVALLAEREARGVLAVALEIELERTLAAAESADPARKLVLTERARTLAAELEGWQRPFQLPAPDLPAVTVQPTNGPQEITLKADFLADRALQLRSAAAVVDRELSRINRRARLQEEIRRLVAEVRLFDVTGVPPSITTDDGTNGESGIDDIDPGVGLSAPADIPVAITPPVERVLDLPVQTTDRSVSTTPTRATTLQRLARLRGDLLQRAQVLERQSQQIRSRLRREP